MAPRNNPRGNACVAGTFPYRHQTTVSGRSPWRVAMSASSRRCDPADLATRSGVRSRSAEGHTVERRGSCRAGPRGASEATAGACRPGPSTATGTDVRLLLRRDRRSNDVIAVDAGRERRNSRARPGRHGRDAARRSERGPRDGTRRGVVVSSVGGTRSPVQIAYARRDTPVVTSLGSEHPGSSAAWQRTCFGSRRSGVQIPPPRRCVRRFI